MRCLPSSSFTSCRRIIIPRFSIWSWRGEKGDRVGGRGGGGGGESQVEDNGRKLQCHAMNLVELANELTNFGPSQLTGGMGGNTTHNTCTHSTTYFPSLPPSLSPPPYLSFSFRCGRSWARSGYFRSWKSFSTASWILGTVGQWDTQ